MQVKIIIFGKLTDITGATSVSLSNLPDTDSLQRELHLRFPALAQAKYIVAVEKQVITTNTILQDNHTVALLPPFSGG